MSKRLIIIGASLLGREVCNYARDAGFLVEGFLDGRQHVLNGYDGYPPIISSVEDFVVRSDVNYICAIGNPQMRMNYTEKVLARRGRFVNVVHPTAYVGPNVKMGVGCIICPHAVVDCDLSLGDHVIINSLSYVSHDSALDDYVTLSPGCHLGGMTHLHRGVFMGIHSATIPNVELGAGVYVAAGACVTHDFFEGRVMGVPGRLR